MKETKKAADHGKPRKCEDSADPIEVGIQPLVDTDQIKGNDTTQSQGDTAKIHPGDANSFPVKRNEDTKVGARKLPNLSVQPTEEKQKINVDKSYMLMDGADLSKS